MTKVQEVALRIKELEGLDLKSKPVTIRFLQGKLRNLLALYISPVIEVNHTRSAYRARKNKKGEPFTRVCDLWYPPPKYAALNRVNRKGQPVFYAADSIDTAVLEVRPEEGDIITVLECKTISKAAPRLKPLGIHEQAKRLNVKIGGRGTNLDSHLRQMGRLTTNRIIDSFLRRTFARIVDSTNREQYKMTIAIAELWQKDLIYTADESEHLIDGLTYPSIATGEMGANVALWTEAADRLYAPMTCHILKIEKKTGHLRYSYRSGKAKAITNSGQILWQM